MSLDLNTIYLFVKVVLFGSYSRAAENLKLPKSTLSRAISRLEEETGTKLLLRTTRTIALTEAGRAFYENCAEPLQLLEDAKKALNEKNNSISGIMRITAPEDIGMNLISKVIAKLTKDYPILQFELFFTNEIIDLIKEGFDIAIRVGKLKSSNLKAKKVGDIIMVLVASPEYLNSINKIEHPADLLNCHCLDVTTRNIKPNWKLIFDTGKTINLEIKTKIIANQMDSLKNLAIQGAGVALIPIFICQEELSSGSLKRVLPNWKSEAMPVYIVSPVGFNSSKRLQVISTALINSLQNLLDQSLFLRNNKEPN
ncbi:LysR family transcriptional regulator [Silvanigrella paludirubra]|uniref:LysR family transcriptional regulator n=1 Tax=Silvanigrella paludirubra TaxID=2499159 RepID=A0A6N6VWX2_9BACT|nr:LysR family transcriptional regulator [Silvanigrella paludirubra]KAB8037937.1 LysR family transcriptional regulator [Silvanigrella paludirubra]